MDEQPKILFISELYQASSRTNEEKLIDDTIFELIGDPDLDTLFRLYTKLKDSIPSGLILKQSSTGVTLSNTVDIADKKTHAYLVENSLNFLTGDSLVYSVDEITGVLDRLTTLKNRIIQLNEQVNASVQIINSFSGILTGMNKSITDYMVSGNNETKYSDAVINFMNELTTYNSTIISDGIGAFLPENQTTDLKTFTAP